MATNLPTLDPFDGEARRQIERLMEAARAVGVAPRGPVECPFGIGFVVAKSENAFVVVSTNFAESAPFAYLTTGVLKDLRSARDSLLDTCNLITRDNPLFPVYLHDAEAGWDLIQSQRLPVDLLIAQPAFFSELLAYGPASAEQAAARFIERDLCGDAQPYGLSMDLERLLIRSLV